MGRMEYMLSIFFRIIYDHLEHMQWNTGKKLQPSRNSVSFVKFKFD